MRSFTLIALSGRLRPQTATCPLVWVRMPTRILIVVLLPAPFGPSSPMISPLFRLNEISCRTSVVPYRKTSLLTSTMCWVGFIGSFLAEHCNLRMSKSSSANPICSPFRSDSTHAGTPQWAYSTPLARLALTGAALCRAHLAYPSELPVLLYFPAEALGR